MIRNTRMKRFSIVSVVATVGALVFSTLPAQAADPGLSSKEIVLGYSAHLLAQPVRFTENYQEP